MRNTHPICDKRKRLFGYCSNHPSTFPATENTQGHGTKVKKSLIAITHTRQLFLTRNGPHSSPFLVCECRYSANKNAKKRKDKFCFGTRAVWNRVQSSGVCSLHRYTSKKRKGRRYGIYEIYPIQPNDWNSDLRSAQPPDFRDNPKTLQRLSSSAREHCTEISLVISVNALHRKSSKRVLFRSSLGSENKKESDSVDLYYKRGHKKRLSTHPVLVWVAFLFFSMEHWNSHYDYSGSGEQ